MKRLRHHRILLIALAAMLLRAAIPAGWMPAAGTAFALCTAAGLIERTAALDPSVPHPPSQPAVADPSHCVFSLGGTPMAAGDTFLPAPTYRVDALVAALRPAVPLRERYRNLRSARAPPA